jgi:hypothetical protein
MPDRCGPEVPVDWWSRRESERALAAELHLAKENLRLAQLRVRDSLTTISTGIQPPDSHLVLRHALAEAKTAGDHFAEALRRWKNFVLNATEDPLPKSS